MVLRFKWFNAIKSSTNIHYTLQGETPHYLAVLPITSFVSGGLATAVSPATLRIPADILGGSGRGWMGRETSWTFCPCSMKLRASLDFHHPSWDFLLCFRIQNHQNQGKRESHTLTVCSRFSRSCDDKSCCQARDLFKTHRSRRAAWGGLEGWAKLRGQITDESIEQEKAHNRKWLIHWSIDPITFSHRGDLN